MGFEGRPEGKDNGNYLLIYCMCVPDIYLCASVFPALFPKDPPPLPHSNRESCLKLDYSDDGKESDDRNTRRDFC